MEKIYWHKPFSRHYNKPVDHFLFLLAVYLTGRVWTLDLFLVMIVNLT